MKYVLAAETGLGLAQSTAAHLCEEYGYCLVLTFGVYPKVRMLSVLSAGSLSTAVISMSYNCRSEKSQSQSHTKRRK